MSSQIPTGQETCTAPQPCWICDMRKSSCLCMELSRDSLIVKSVFQALYRQNYYYGYKHRSGCFSLRNKPRNTEHVTFYTEKVIVSFPKRPDLLWCSPSFIFTGQRGQLPCGDSGRIVRLTIHFPLASRLRMNTAVLPLPLYALMACTGPTLPIHSVWCFHLHPLPARATENL